MKLGDADVLGQIADLGRAIAGNDHDAIELMCRLKMFDERPAVVPRRVAEPQNRSRAIVDDHDALEAADDVRERTPPLDAVRCCTRTTRNTDASARYDTPQPRARRLVHLRRLEKRRRCRTCRKDRARQRMP